MHVVDKVMVWLGFERCDEPATSDHEGKVLYKKRGVNVIPHRDYQSASLQSEAAARAHIELTLFDKAVLWIFEKIVSPLMKPLPMSPAVTVAAADITDPATSNTNIDALSEKKRVAEEEFSAQKKVIKTFLDNEFWPSGGHVFSDEVRNIANDHWEKFEKLTEKSSASEEDRVTYATAAFVLGKGSPSFETIARDLDHGLPLINDDNSKVEAENLVVEIVNPKNTNGEILFYGFHNWDIEKKSVEFLSLGSEYMQSDCLEFAQKIVNNSMTIEFGGKTEFTKDILQSADILLKLKRQLDAAEKKIIKDERALEEQKIIEKKKSSMNQGEWDFNEFLNDFISHQERREKFPLYLNGKYRTNPDLLEFAEKVESDINETDHRRQVAAYLIRWNKHPEHAEKVTNEAVGFSLVPPPPPPPAPPPRKIQAPKVETVPVPPEQSAIIRLFNADGRYQEQLRGLIGFSSPIMRSGLAVLARIWQLDSSSSGKDQNSVQDQLRSVTAEYEAYTDLEEIDNAMKLVEAIAGMQTGHSFELSADIGKIKEYCDVIIQKLAKQRSQVIGSRNISDMADLTANQIVTGQQRFEDFQRAYINSSKRGLLGELKFRDIYFSDECVSYASYTHKKFSAEAKLVGADPDALMAAEYLLKKYNQFKLLSSAENTASA